jgi:hypothetical protein
VTQFTTNDNGAIRREFGSAGFRVRLVAMDKQSSLDEVSRA